MIGVETGEIVAEFTDETTSTAGTASGLTTAATISGTTTSSMGGVIETITGSNSASETN